MSFDALYTELCTNYLKLIGQSAYLSQRTNSRRFLGHLFVFCLSESDFVQPHVVSETGVLSCLNFLDPCWFLGSRCFSNSPLFQYFCQNLDCVPTITPLTVSPNVTLDVDIEHDTETDDHADELLDELHDFKQACLLFSWGKHNK